MIKIIYEDNHLLVVEKPINIPVMEDSSHDKDLLTLLKEDIKVRYSKPGEVYLGLVHRLDRPVGGVMVFAKTSKAASRLSQQISKHEVSKEYHAVVLGQCKHEDTLIDNLYKDKKTNTVFVSNHRNSKHSELSYTTIKTIENYNLVKVKLVTGRSHQIRVQFSSRGLPLWGDQRYNKTAKIGQQIALWATSLTITHPTLKSEMTFTSAPPNSVPWNKF